MTREQRGGGNPSPLAFLVVMMLGALVWLLVLMLARSLGAPDLFMAIAWWAWGLLSLATCGVLACLAVGDLVAAYREAGDREAAAEALDTADVGPWQPPVP